MYNSDVLLPFWNRHPFASITTIMSLVLITVGSVGAYRAFVQSGKNKKTGIVTTEVAKSEEHPEGVRNPAILSLKVEYPLSVRVDEPFVIRVRVTSKTPPFRLTPETLLPFHVSHYDFCWMEQVWT